jgi:hypothetical protein
MSLLAHSLTVKRLQSLRQAPAALLHMQRLAEVHWCMTGNWNSQSVTHVLFQVHFMFAVQSLCSVRKWQRFEQCELAPVVHWHIALFSQDDGAGSKAQLRWHSRIWSVHMHPESVSHDILSV